MIHVKFQDATRENEERLRRKKALAKYKESDSSVAMFKAIFFPAISLILTITGICFLIINEAPVWVWVLTVLLLMAAALWSIICWGVQQSDKDYMHDEDYN
jgi:hypothetical protein